MTIGSRPTHAPDGWARRRCQRPRERNSDDRALGGRLSIGLAGLLLAATCSSCAGRDGRHPQPAGAPQNEHQRPGAVARQPVGRRARLSPGASAGHLHAAGGLRSGAGNRVERRRLAIAPLPRGSHPARDSRRQHGCLAGDFRAPVDRDAVHQPRRLGKRQAPGRLVAGELVDRRRRCLQRVGLSRNPGNLVRDRQAARSHEAHVSRPGSERSLFSLRRGDDHASPQDGH